MGILDRDYAKDQIRQADSNGGKNSKNNWLLYLAIAIALGFLIYYLVF